MVTKMKLVVFFLAVLSVLESSAAPDWREWRGPTRDGMIHRGAAAWPDRLNKQNFRQTWSAALAEGYSSPIIAGGRVFTVETSDKKNEIVRAFDRKTGKQLWEKAWAGSMKVPFYARKNGSWVRSTPACDGKTLFVGGMRDVLVALDVETGKERWRVDFPQSEETTRPQFGFVCSPLLAPEHIYVQAGSALRKIRKSDGKTVWKVLEDDRAMWGEAFSSPRRATVAGQDQILTQTRMSLAGVAPDSGKILWSTPVKAFRGMNILTPTAVGDHVFTATYGGGCFYYKISGEGAAQQWNDKLEGYMSSPVVIDGMVYLHGRDKRLHCIDPGKGTILWSTKEKFGEYWSMVANGKRVLALDQTGELVLFQADPRAFQLIDRIKVSDRPTWAHVAVCGPEVLVRDLKGITAYRWK